MIGLVYALIFYEKVCSYSIPLGLSYYIGKMVVAGEGGWLIFWVPFISDILEYYDSSKTHVKDNKKNIYILDYVRDTLSPSQLNSRSHSKGYSTQKDTRQVHSADPRHFHSAIRS